jgi:hypothetical protein
VLRGEVCSHLSGVDDCFKLRVLVLDSFDGVFCLNTDWHGVGTTYDSVAELFCSLLVCN